VWTHACVVQGETEKEAKEFYDDYVHRRGDWAAAQNVIDAMSAEINQKDMPPARHKAMSEMFIAGWGGHPLVGTREQIVEKLDGLSRMGMDGVLLSWPRFEDGMKEFRDKTLPLVKQAGLRDF
jgi:FMNH2-dependent dimethyl sulfone monooxygenase